MAKAEQRSNSAAKKPKKDRPKEAVARSPLANAAKDGTQAKPFAATR